MKRRGLVLAAGVMAGVAAFIAWKVYHRAPDLPEQTNSIGMKFVKVPAGSYQMGSPKDEKDRDDDEEQHEVEITRPFWLGAHEVTQEQFEKVMGFNPTVAGRQADYPIEVSHDEALTFCKKLSDLPEEKAARRAYRLPTEAEWEYACRAGTTTPYALGKDLPASKANRGELAQIKDSKDLIIKQQEPKAVGSFSPNRWGLYDMHGSVYEWCSDWYDHDYFRLSPKQDPQGPETGEQRVVRGGSRASATESCRSANRAGFGPDVRLDVGLRVVLVEEEK